MAKLFSSQLASEESIQEEFLPALRDIATCDWEGIEQVAIYMLAILVHKKKKRGVALVVDALPTKVTITVGTPHIKNVVQNV